MISRVLLIVLALAILSGLLYMQQPGGSGTEPTAQMTRNAPGFVAMGAELIETGDDGQPLYRLEADRIAQPMSAGTVYLTSPTLHYEPEGGNPWVLTARAGQLPQDAQIADLSGSVEARGKPTGSAAPMRINTDRLHVDMRQQVATTAADVQVHWAGSLLRGRGMQANLKSGEVKLLRDVSGALGH